MTSARPSPEDSRTPARPTLTGSHGFRFAASRRLANEAWPAERNLEIYDTTRNTPWGHGENYRAHLIFQGVPDPETWTLPGLCSCRAALDELLRDRYDCHFLNRDHPAFRAVPPTTENLARGILREAAGARAQGGAALVTCHLEESPATGATAYASGLIERDFWISFSAARQTCSPHLSEEENRTVFGDAASPLGHGHGYRLRVVLSGTWDEESGQVAPLAHCRRVLEEVHRKLDHKHLNLEVPEWRDQPMTTECMARSLHAMLARELSVARVVLFETPEFFAEYDGRRAALGLTRSFSATHRLYKQHLSKEENQRAFGRCGRASGHGHRYSVQATVAGPIDERTGIVQELNGFTRVLEGVLADFDDRRLERDLAEFRDRPGTCENILSALWNRLDPLLEDKLSRLRLWMAEDGRFTLRAEGAPGGP